MLYAFLKAKATNPPAKWNPKKFPELAITHQLVLTGWGPDIRSAPKHDWEERKAGGLTQANWMHLVFRIPQHYMSNPHYEVPDGEFALEFVPLEEFLEQYPGTLHLQSILQHSLTALAEYEGRHPCIVNHAGKVIHFAGEDKAALAGTAPGKSSKTKPMKLTVPDASESEEPSDGEVLATSPRNVRIGTASPGGPARKRARVLPPISPVHRGPERPMKAIPTRASGDTHRPIAETKKRKRPDAGATHSSEQWGQQDPGLAENLHTDLFPHQDRGVTPLFQTPFPPAPFAMQAPYGGHAAFSGQGYQAPFYPPNYAPQAWPASNPANGHQQWPGSQNYTSEELDAFLATRRGGYGQGQQY